MGESAPCSMALEDASRSPHILTETTAASRRRTDQSLAASLAADEEVPQPSGQSVLHLASLGIPTPQPRCCEWCARPPIGPARPANMHAIGRRSQGSSNRLDPSHGCR
jgi:hypothetical protein